MYFNALLREIGSAEIQNFCSDCTPLLTENKFDQKFETKIAEFRDTRWALVQCSYFTAEHSPRYFKPTPAYYALLETLLTLIGPQYYVVTSMVAWLNPGQKLDKHIDLQKVYANTRRIHVQLLQDPGAYLSVWSGSREHRCNLPPGNIYELNNRVPHSVTHSGNSSQYAILVVDFGVRGEIFTQQDNIDRDLTLLSSEGLELWI